MKLFDNMRDEFVIDDQNETLEELMVIVDEKGVMLDKYMSVFNTTTEALDALTKIGSVAKSDDRVYDITMESINDQLGYPEGTRLTTEGVGGSIKEFARRVWEKIKAVWRAIKEAYVKMILRFTSWVRGVNNKQMADFVKDYSKIIANSKISGDRKTEMTKKVEAIIEANKEVDVYPTAALDRLYDVSPNTLIDSIRDKKEVKVDTGKVTLVAKDGKVASTDTAVSTRSMPLEKAISSLGSYTSTLKRVETYLDSVEKLIDSKKDEAEEFAELGKAMTILTAGNKNLISAVQPLMKTYSELVQIKRTIKGDGMVERDKIDENSQRLI